MQKQTKSSGGKRLVRNPVDLQSGSLKRQNVSSDKGGCREPRRSTVRLSYQWRRDARVCPWLARGAKLGQGMMRVTGRSRHRTCPQSSAPRDGSSHRTGLSNLNTAQCYGTTVVHWPWVLSDPAGRTAGRMQHQKARSTTMGMRRRARWSPEGCRLQAKIQYPKETANGDVDTVRSLPKAADE